MCKFVVETYRMFELDNTAQLAAQRISDKRGCSHFRKGFLLKTLKNYYLKFKYTCF